MFRQGRDRAMIGLMVVLGVFGQPLVSRAQEAQEPADARFHLGPLGLSPTIRVSNFGWDSNILHQNDRPTGDVTATLSPALNAALRLARVRVNGRSQLDFFYFRELDEYNAVDNDSSLRAELQLNRLTPFVGGRLLNTRHRQNLEIDALAQRHDNQLSAGADLRLTSKVTAGVYGARNHFEYEADSGVAEIFARSLNHTGTSKGVAFRYAATPLTTFAVNLSHQRDEFVSSPERNSKSVRVEPSVEFKPLALVSGRAAIGFRKHTFLDGGVNEFKGTVVSVDLQYTLRARTQFAIGARRDLEYSFLYRDYLLGGLTLSVTQRLGDAWEVGGSVGRYRLSYRAQEFAQSPDETTVNTGAIIGYNLGRSARVGLQADYYTRTSEVSLGRRYNRVRVGSSLSYNF